MKVKSLQIENLQSFFGKENVFEFTDGVNLISGLNSGGKSAIFNAFNWVLYNRLYITDKGWNEGIAVRDLCDRAKAEKVNTIDLSVKLIILAPNFTSPNKEEVEFTFYRKAIFEKEKNHIEVMDDGSEVEISFIDSVGQTIHCQITDLDRILPNSIKDYIWFQGESIDELIDFSNPKTLIKAINQISYYPIYEKINNVIAGVSTRVSNNIRKQANAVSSGNTKDQRVLNQITEIENKQRTNKKKINDAIEKIAQYKLDKIDVDKKLEGLVTARQYADEIDELNTKDEILKQRAKNIEQNEKEKLINTWMLKGTASKLKVAKELILAFSNEIKEKSTTDNPIPREVPGSEYIKQMLHDETCYICEREAKKGSKEFEAMNKRLVSSQEQFKKYRKKKEEFDLLNNNYMSLVNLPDAIIYKVNSVDEEIEKDQKDRQSIYNSRIAIAEEIKSIIEKAGVSDSSALAASALHQKKLLQKLSFCNSNISSFESAKQRMVADNVQFKNLLVTLKEKRKSITSKVKDIPEQKAEDSVLFLETLCERLKSEAKDRLLNEIEKKATDIYTEYLKNSESFVGHIKINRENFDISIYGEEGPVIVNKGAATAAKMSVVNSVLYLSALKLGKSYPMISDAPSSVFDVKNTTAYTEKVGESFEQVIIMTKDVWGFEESLKENKHVKCIYKINTRKDREDLSNLNRSNYRTFITKLY